MWASAPTEALQEVRWEESPSHGFAVPAPFRQGGHGDGGYGLPRPVFALASQWHWFFMGVRYAAGHMGPALRMFFQIKKENAGGVLLTV